MAGAVLRAGEEEGDIIMLSSALLRLELREGGGGSISVAAADMTRLVSRECWPGRAIMSSSVEVVSSRRGGWSQRLSSHGPVRLGVAGQRADLKKSLSENSDPGSRRPMESSILS